MDDPTILRLAVLTVAAVGLVSAAAVARAAVAADHRSWLSIVVGGAVGFGLVYVSYVLASGWWYV